MIFWLLFHCGHLYEVISPKIDKLVTDMSYRNKGSLVPEKFYGRPVEFYDVHRTGN